MLMKNLRLTLLALAALLAWGMPQRMAAVNPFLPLWEYIPDGEPYVFEDPDRPGHYRVYVYGSHDSMKTEYCGREQVVWSAPVENLNDWRYGGIIFESKTGADGQLLNEGGIGDILYAPDIVEVKGRDGKKTYYLYPNNQSEGRKSMVARADRPDGPFTFGGTIVSNGDVGYRGRRESDRLNHTGTTHGSIEKINGRWYVFYHRQTHGSDYSRQACAEPIEILPDGSIPQVEITSCGLNGGPLKGEGEYPAVICCNLTNGRMPHGGNAAFSGLPMVTNEGEERFLTGLKAGTLIAYKYFDLSKTREVFVTVRGKGTIALEGASVDADSLEWKEYRLPVTAHGEREALTFRITAGELEMLKFRLAGREEDR